MGPEALILPGHLLGILRKLKRVEKFLDISIQDVVQVIDGEADAMVRHPALWEIVGPDLGAAVSCADEAFPVTGNFFFLFAYLFFV